METETKSEKKDFNLLKQLVTDATVEFATLLHRLDDTNFRADVSDEGFEQLNFSVPMSDGKYLHIDLKVNEEKGMVK